MEITVLSAEDLRIDDKPLKNTTTSYVVVSTDPYNRLTTDQSGGSHPSWNHRLVVDFPATTSSVTLEVRCKTFSGDRAVGSVSVPVSDIVGGYAPENVLQFMSYRLRDGKWRRNGIIDFSVKVIRQLPPTGFPAKRVEKGYPAETGVAIGVLAWTTPSTAVYPPPYHH